MQTIRTSTKKADVLIFFAMAFGLLWLLADISQNTAIDIENMAVDCVRGV